MAAKKKSSSDYDGYDDDEDNDDSDDFDSELDDAEDDVSDGPKDGIRGRDWRDIERFREERELRKLIDDDLDWDEDERPSRRRAG